MTFAFRMDVVGGEGGVRVALEELAAEQELHASMVRRELDLAHARSSHAKIRFFDGYCSTVQGLLDWFEVDLGFT